VRHAAVFVLVALIAGVASAADAQVLDSRVTLSGFFDVVTTAGTNVFDSNFALRDDSAWATRSRTRLRLTSDFEPLRLLGVLELEIDFAWGETGRAVAPGFGIGGVSAPIVGLEDITEIKNAYVEFPLPAPSWVPFTTVRLGAQPFRTTLKPAVLATGDYAGVSLDTDLCSIAGRSPFCHDARLAFLYAQLEESLTGTESSRARNRGDDFFAFVSATYPFDVPRVALRVIPRVFWAYLHAEGVTAAQARCRIACAGVPLNGFDPAGTLLAAGTPETTLGNFQPGSQESRHYVGIDQDIQLELGRAGWLRIQPTVIYMLARADVFGTSGVPNATACGSDAGVRCPTGSRQSSTSQSWLVDIRAGWVCDGRCLNETGLGNLVRIGESIHAEALFMWTPGDASHHNVFRRNRVFHPLTTDGDYLSGWNEILATGSVDYLTGNAHGMGDNIGLGQYGRWQIGTRLTWEVWREWDRALRFHTKASWVWTDQKVDTDAATAQRGRGAGSYGNVPCALLEDNCPAGNNRRGDARYVGTEASIGMTYQFHRHIVFDAVAAYLFAGSALDSTVRESDGTFVKHRARDAHLIAARVRYSF
jgi:hypothetical protein